MRNVGLTQIRLPLSCHPHKSLPIIFKIFRLVEKNVKNRTLGSVFIVAGTTIGAGMLAMPLAAAGVGFGVTLALLVGLWLLMCYTALLLVEVYQHEQADTGLGTLAKRYLGGGGQWLTSFSMMFLMYALTAAYISGAGELLATSISQWTSQDFPVSLGVLLFTRWPAAWCASAPLGGLVQPHPVQRQSGVSGGDARPDVAEYPPDQSDDVAAGARPGVIGHSGDLHFIWLPRQRAEHRQLHGRQHSQTALGVYHRQRHPADRLYLLAAGDAGQHQLRHLRRHSGAAGRAERPVAGGARCGGFAAR